MFEVDLPESYLTDGTWIRQMVTLSPTDNSGEKRTIGCSVQIGNAYSTKAVEWVGSADMDFATTGTGTVFSDINTSERQNESSIYGMDGDSIALKESDLSW